MALQWVSEDLTGSGARPLDFEDLARAQTLGPIIAAKTCQAGI